ncbi:MAG TPA: histidine phosphatase family protein [Gemmataceae bacterium]|nr:histidine phosphatase family protein [Gemmataceae bacterium]
METVLYLIRHGATEANLARPALLQGRHHDAGLAPLGIRQAQATRDFLAIRPIDYCYSSPLRRAVQTAEIVSKPHGLKPGILEALTECDIGRWEGMDWASIREKDETACHRFMTRPGKFGYPGGETFADVYNRVAPVLDELLHKHVGHSMLVVAHHIVNRTYLAGLLGLKPDQARQVSLDNCGISVVVKQGESTTVSTLNAAFHLQGVAA